MYVRYRISGLSGENEFTQKSHDGPSRGGLGNHRSTWTGNGEEEGSREEGEKSRWEVYVGRERRRRVMAGNSLSWSCAVDCRRRTTSTVRRLASPSAWPRSGRAWAWQVLVGHPVFKEWDVCRKPCCMTWPARLYRALGQGACGRASLCCPLMGRAGPRLSNGLAHLPGWC